MFIINFPADDGGWLWRTSISGNRACAMAWIAFSWFCYAFLSLHRWTFTCYCLQGKLRLSLLLAYGYFCSAVIVWVVFQKVGDRMDATKKAIMRAVKLFVLGVFLQGKQYNWRTYFIKCRRIITIKLPSLLHWMLIKFLVLVKTNSTLKNNFVRRDNLMLLTY